MPPKKVIQSYKHFVTALKSTTDELPPIIFAFGPSNYLRIKVEEWFSNRSGKQTQVEKHYAESMTKVDFDKILFQDSIFEPSSFHIIKNFEKKSEIQKSLSDIGEGRRIRNKLLLVSASRSVPAALMKNFSRLKVKTIPCFEPNHYELPKFLKSLSAKYSLKLDGSAIESLIESVGSDLFKLENEIKKLSLIFADSTGEFSRSDLAPYLNCLKQEHAFKLDQLLIGGHIAVAQALLHDLLKRGESHLALLGIISHHCRKALQIGQLFKSGKQVNEIARIVGLPFGIVKNYIPYVRSTPPQIFKVALFKCQEADMIFKTSRLNSEIVISEIIAHLAKA